jgi:hypothetical protein
MSKILFPTTIKQFALRRRNTENKWAIMNASSLYCYPPVNIRLFASRARALDELKYQARPGQANAEVFEVTVSWKEDEEGEGGNGEGGNA